jgi:hypothetical protein
MLAVSADAMTTSNRNLYLAPLLALLLVLGVVGYRHLRSSPLDGTWLKASGAAQLPDEMTIRLTRSQFTTRYRAVPWGVEHVTLLLDGREHLFWAMPGGGFKISYRAELDGSTVVVTKHVETPGKDLGSFTERWSLTEGGHKLIVSVGGDETVFRRPPFLRSLFVSSP